MEELLNIFEKIITGKAAGAQRNDRLFLNSLRRWLKGDGLSYADDACPTAAGVAAYGSWLTATGVSDTTKERYLQRYRALWRRALKEGLCPTHPGDNSAGDPFACVGSGRGRPRVKGSAISAATAAGGTIIRAIDIARAMAQPRQIGEPEMLARARALWWFAFCAGGLDLQQVLDIRPEDIAEHRLSAGGRTMEMLPQMSHVAGLFGQLGRERLFTASARGDGMALARLCEGALLRMGIKLAEVTTDLPTRCWREIAIATGTWPITADADVTPADDSLRRVADAVANTRRGWWAMHMRPYKKAEELLKLIAATEPATETYYPYGEIASRVGERTMVAARAHVGPIVFVRCTEGEMERLNTECSELAWTYRSNFMPGAQFARIGDYEMMRFINIVNALNEEVRLPDEDPATLMGRRVLVTGGPLRGYEGEIADVTTEDGRHMRIIRLNLLTDTGIKIMTDIEDKDIRILSER